MYRYTHKNTHKQVQTHPSAQSYIPEGRAMDGVVPGVGAVVGHGVELV